MNELGNLVDPAGDEIMAASLDALKLGCNLVRSWGTMKTLLVTSLCEAFFRVQGFWAAFASVVFAEFVLFSAMGAESYDGESACEMWGWILLFAIAFCLALAMLHSCVVWMKKKMTTALISLLHPGDDTYRASEYNVAKAEALERQYKNMVLRLDQQKERTSEIEKEKLQILGDLNAEKAEKEDILAKFRSKCEEVLILEKALHDLKIDSAEPRFGSGGLRLNQKLFVTNSGNTWHIDKTCQYLRQSCVEKHPCTKCTHRSGIVHWQYYFYARGVGKVYGGKKATLVNIVVGR